MEGLGGLEVKRGVERQRRRFYGERVQRFAEGIHALHLAEESENQIRRNFSGERQFMASEGVESRRLQDI